MSQKTIWITGASSGIGREFARRYAKLGFRLILTARRRERLELLAAELHAKYGTLCRIETADLGLDADCDALCAALADEHIDLFINNAGFGKLGNVADLPYIDGARMVDLNCRALTVLSTLVLPYMQKGSFILNVCSIAAFVPNTRLTVYSSTKAYVFSFSTALRRELKPRGIRVLAVCPGPMATEFLPVAGIENGASKTFERLPYCDPARVARIALKKAQKGRAVYTPRGFYKFYRVLAKLLPHNWLMPLSGA